MPGDDKLAEWPPHGAGDLVVAARDGQVGLVVVCAERMALDRNFFLPLVPQLAI